MSRVPGELHRSWRVDDLEWEDSWCASEAAELNIHEA